MARIGRTAAVATCVATAISGSVLMWGTAQAESPSAIVDVCNDDTELGVTDFSVRGLNQNGEEVTWPNDESDHPLPPAPDCRRVADFWWQKGQTVQIAYYYREGEEQLAGCSIPAAAGDVFTCHIHDQTR